MRTTLAAGVLAAAAIFGSAGSALAHDYDDHHGSRGETAGCGIVAGAANGKGFYAEGCGGSRWEGAAPNHRFPF
ncbi:hypothetical protein ACIQOU_06100 [Streptomyces sp. NPDC091279]|uniref:hypothetical protein n=1 Tax=unclassified Streptomyces TaxID=2593676 RepID=UPI0038184AE3